MPRLSVNIDHVATVRQARLANEPDPVAAAVLADIAGAHGITCHIRGDRRHVNENDLRRLREAVSSSLNVEMAATDEMLKIARKIKPDLVTIVPERAGEVTTEGGIDAAKLEKKLAPHIGALKRSRIEVSLFVDPDARQIEVAANLGVPIVELNTNAYAEARNEKARKKALLALIDATADAIAHGLIVAAGHGLTVRNVGPVAAIPGMDELNIGHSIVSRAVLIGMERAVTEMLEAMDDAR